jgi:hypothetical protein
MEDSRTRDITHRGRWAHGRADTGLGRRRRRKREVGVIPVEDSVGLITAALLRGEAGAV